jgi:hypothetical protein
VVTASTEQGECPTGIESIATRLLPDASRPDVWITNYPGARVYVLMGEHRVIWQKQAVGKVQYLMGDDVEEINGNSSEAYTRLDVRWDELKRKEVDG